MGRLALLGRIVLEAQRRVSLPPWTRAEGALTCSDGSSSAGPSGLRWQAVVFVKAIAEMAEKFVPIGCIFTIRKISINSRLSN
jgi:hypothetical protein